MRRANVQAGGEEFETDPGEYRYIPVYEQRRLTKNFESECEVIVVREGGYLGEIHIKRLEDIYRRIES